MNKIPVIIQREYKTRVAKRSFLLLTILVPLLIFGFYAAMIAIAVSGGGEGEKIAVIDEGNIFNNSYKANDNISLSFIHNEIDTTFQKKFIDQGYTAYLYIPANYAAKKQVTVYSKSQMGPVTKGKIEKIINSTIEANRMAALNITPEQVQQIKSDISVDNQKKGSGNKFEKSSAEGSAVVGYVAGFLIYITMFIYGMMVMRGVMEEKINRISEVIISSVKPFQLMIGKIVGIAAVGLTQFIIWIGLIYILQLLIPVFFPAMAAPGAAQAAPMGGSMAMVSQALSTMNFPLIIFAFIFYFIGGYLLYSSLFAAVGSVVSDDQQEAQQLTLPITMPIVLSFVIMAKAASEPNSPLAVFGSIFPLTSPIVMMGRIGYGVPWEQLTISMVLLVLGFIFTTWMAGKIYRTGILLYGKKASWKEMLKWAFRKS